MILHRCNLIFITLSTEVELTYKPRGYIIYDFGRRDPHTFENHTALFFPPQLSQVAYLKLFFDCFL